MHHQRQKANHRVSAVDEPGFRSDRSMGRHGFLHLAAAGGGSLVAGASVLAASAPVLVVGAAAVLGGASGAALFAAFRATGARKAAEARFDTLAAEMVLLRQRQAEMEARLTDVAQRNVESPALIWRAATADIQVLGGLVTNLARAVAEHEEKLADIGDSLPAKTPQGAASAGMILPQTMPPPASWFEDEGLAEDDASDAIAASPAVAPQPTRASIMAELKSTLATALVSDRLELCLQPFVTLPQRKVAGYEASLALKAESGELQGAEDLRAAAEAAGMGRDLDRILVERVGQVLRVLRARERSVAITCRIGGESLADTAFRSTVEAVALAEGKLAQNIILSFPLADAARLRAEIAPAMDAVRRTGVMLGVRSATTAGIDAGALERLGISEIRLAAAALNVDTAIDIHPADIGEMLERRNIRLLITGVDSEATVRDLLDFATPLAQGDLFGAARPVRPEVLQPRAVAGANAGAAASPRAAPRPAAPAPAGQPRRQSFRSLLRRA
jgi:cyclic-di-GMP phosphodiesterase, flagellum assembly factor TipF